MKMDYLKPDVFKAEGNILAVFTKANRGNYKPDAAIPGLNLGFNSAAGKDEIRENYRQLATDLGVPAENLALAKQVHGTDIKVINKPGVFDACDGLITTHDGLYLGIQVADCAAVLLADHKHGVAGAFHAGWRGAAGNIIPKGFQKMAELGADPHHTRAFISPGISLQSFEVGEEVASQFPAQFCDYERYAKPHVDLKGFIRWQLENAGLAKYHIEISQACTMKDPQFYSYRRERNNSGRMLALIGLT